MKRFKYALLAISLIALLVPFKSPKAVEADNFCLNNTTGLFVACPTDTSNRPIITLNQGTPSNVTVTNATGSGTTLAVTVNLNGAAQKITYLCGFEADSQATAATSGTLAVNGGGGGGMNFLQPISAAPAVGVTKINFTPCLASTLGAGLQVVTFAPGAGGVTQLSLWGYQQ